MRRLGLERDHRHHRGWQVAVAALLGGPDQLLEVEGVAVGERDQAIDLGLGGLAEAGPRQLLGCLARQLAKSGLLDAPLLPEAGERLVD